MNEFSGGIFTPAVGEVRSVGKDNSRSRIGQTKNGGGKLNRLNKWTGTNRAAFAGSDTLVNEVIEQENLHRTQCSRSDAAAYAGQDAS